MKPALRLITLIWLLPLTAFSADPAPQNVVELWADFDPRQEPLEVEVVREWKEDGGVYRYVRYMIGDFKGQPARMAAFYGYPEDAAGKLPAVMHMHGGGQRAFLQEVKTYVDRGYAALSVNWGGREMEGAQPGDPNTEWGSVDPTQQNVPGYFNLMPGDKFLVELFARTLGFENYAPHIECPVLHLSGTNDFHGWMDDVYRTNALIKGQPLRFAFSPHLNHRFIPEVAVTRPLWLDQFLNDGPALPGTPVSRLRLKTADGVPVIHVTPKTSAMPVVRVDVYYSVDPDPRARFWRDAGAVKVADERSDTVQSGETWEARLPLLSTDEPLYAFANVYFELPNSQTLPHMGSITEVCLSSWLHAALPAQLKSSGVRATDAKSLLIDDFTRGWHDWYRLNAQHKPFWQNWTRKVTDPKWRGPDDAQLAITLTMSEANSISIVAIENEWRSYRGKKKAFVCQYDVVSDQNPQTIVVSASDFQDADGNVLSNWDELDQLGLCARFEARGRQGQDAPNPTRWNGDFPKFHKVQWQRSTASR